MMGRRTKLTPAVQEGICNSIKKGLYLHRACNLCGVAEHTYYDWMERGRLGGPGNELYTNFLHAVKRAEAEDIEARLTEARNYAVSRKSWEETYRYLESRYPQEYGRKLAVQHLEDKEAQARYLQLIQILKPDTRAQIVEAEVRVLKEVNDAV